MTTSPRKPRHASSPPPAGATPGSPFADPAKPTVGELFATASEQIANLVRDEIELTKVQAIEKGKRLGMGAAGLVAAGVLAAYAFGILLLAAVWGIGQALPLWLSALIVGVGLLLIAGIAALIGKKKLDASKQINPKPQEGMKKNVDAIKKGINK